MNYAFMQISKISRLNLAKDINQYIVVCGGDGTLSPILKQFNEYNPDFSKIAFTMLPLGQLNDISRTLKTHKLKKYTSKESNFKPKNLHNTIGKIIFKLLQADVKAMDT